MLLIVNLSSERDTFPLSVLEQVDTILFSLGYKKEIRSVIIPGKQFSTTYEGPDVEIRKVEDVLKHIAETNGIHFTVEPEQSIRFP
jgi:hypothetical protein